MALDYNTLKAYIDGLYADGSLSEQDYNDIIVYILANGDVQNAPRDLIQIRRGNESDVPNLAQGEMGFSLDTEKIFVGGLNGNVEFLKNTEIFHIVDDINNIPSGVTHVVFQQGKIYETNIPINIPTSVKFINGNGAKIVYDKVQVDEEGMAQSCFNIDGCDNLTIENLKIEYVGLFDLGYSYAGLICGIRILNSNDIFVDNVEVSGFNYTGLIVAGEKTTTSYCNNVTINNCNFHHNRVAGIYFGNTERLIIKNNQLKNNGL